MQVTLIRVFVSSPGDVAQEREVLGEVVASINRTDGQAGGFRLESAPSVALLPSWVVERSDDLRSRCA